MLSHCFNTALVSLYHRFNTAVAASDFQGARLDNQDGRLESLRARHETIMYRKRFSIQLPIRPTVFDSAF